jgi:hypothetical protein
VVTENRVQTGKYAAKKLEFPVQILRTSKQEIAGNHNQSFASNE